MSADSPLSRRNMYMADEEDVDDVTSDDEEKEEEYIVVSSEQEESDNDEQDVDDVTSGDEDLIVVSSEQEDISDDDMEEEEAEDDDDDEGIENDSSRISSSIESSESCTDAESQGSSNDKNETTEFSGFTCKYCAATSLDSYLVYRDHLESLHSISRNHCVECERTMKNRKALTKHTWDVHRILQGERKFYGCKFCPAFFYRACLYRKHVESEHSILPYQCVECKKIMTSNARLWQHVQEVHYRKRFYVCPHCEERSPYKHAMDRHVALGHQKHQDGSNGSDYKSSPTACSYCPSILKTPRAVKKHLIKMHLDRLPDTLRCDACSKYYLSASLLDLHKKQTHSENDRKFKCQFCTAAFFDKKCLRRHLRNLHVNDRPSPYRCEICLKRFHTPNGLSMHKIRAHKRRKEARKSDGTNPKKQSNNASNKAK